MSDRVVSILRTAVPTAWGALLGLLLPHIPWLPAAVSEWLQSVAVVEVIVGLCIVGWYAVWRWAEPRIPAWLVTLVLGSSRTPVYVGAKSGSVAINDEYRFWAALPADVTEDWSSPEDSANDKPGRHEA